MRLWANVVAAVGLLLGSLSGVVAATLAWEHNPQNTSGEYPYLILLVFYAWLALVSLPFLVVRHAMLFRNRVLGIGGLLSVVLMGVLVGGKVVEIGELNYGQKLLGLFAAIYAVPHFLDLILPVRHRRK